MKFRKNCKICIAVIANPSLVNRFYESKYFGNKGRSTESLFQIAQRTGLNYAGLINHLKNHQAPTEEDLSKAQISRMVKDNTQQHIQKALTTRDKRAALIDKMFAKLESGEFDEKMTVKDLITTLKHADDVDAKAKDQGIDILRMMQGSRSTPTLDAATPYEQFDPWSGDSENRHPDEEATEGTLVT